MIDKIRKVLEQIAEDEKTPTLDVVLANYETALLQTKEEDKNLEGVKLERRALTVLKTFYTRQIYSKGSPMTFIPFGVSVAPMDKNKKLRDVILEDWKDPGKRAVMIKRGEVMFMTIGEDRVPIKSFDIKDTHSEKKGDYTELIIDKGEPCDLGAGDIPLPRDYRKKVKYASGEGEYENLIPYSKPLTPNWTMTLFGVGFFDGIKKIKNKESGEIEEVEKVLVKVVKNQKTGKIKIVSSDAIKARVQIYGVLANPHSEHFLGKEAIWFMPLKFNASENNRSNSAYIQASLKGAVELGLKNIDIEKLVSFINKKVSMYYINLYKIASKMRDKAKDEKDEVLMKKAKEVLKKANLFKPFTVESGKQYIPTIDLVEIDDYHMDYAVQYKEPDEDDDEDEELIIDKNKEGWDNVDFNAFALIKCSYQGFFSKAGKKPKMILTDWSIPGSIFAGFVPLLKTDIENGEVYISLTTSRGSSVYDESTGKYVKDPENAVPIPKIRGIKLVKGLKGIVKKYEEKLSGD